MRNLFDNLTEGVVSVITTAPISSTLDQISAALSRRLGEGVPIEPIRDEDSALEHTRAYIQLGRRLFKDRMQREVILPEDCPDEHRPCYPLTCATIIEVYEGLREGQADVVPGDLLPELNLRLYQRVHKESQSCADYVPLASARCNLKPCSLRQLPHRRLPTSWSAFPSLEGNRYSSSTSQCL